MHCERSVEKVDNILPQAEFAFNSSTNRTTGYSPFEVAYGLKPKQPVDLIPLPTSVRTSQDGDAFARHIRDIHEKVREKIKISNENYKEAADAHRRYIQFQEGDLVMVRLRPERFHPSTYQKLQAKKAGPFRTSGADTSLRESFPALYSMASSKDAWVVGVWDGGIDQERFISDTIFWQDQVSHYYRLMNVNKTDIRNVMDMNALIGGFAVALNTFPVWVMNVVPASMNNSLSAIYDRGLIGSFHDWCEPFSTYPRTYDLLHANHLFSHYQNHGEGCLLEDIMLEMDRILRPQGFIIIRDNEQITSRIRDIAPKFLWEVESHLLENEQKKMDSVLIARKKFWAIV
ncbi:putative methyltransferase PMT7 [Vitis vinifera]|uniref:Methyltransferase n=1 Tax=Vitis vinifera TaxID=29760 RepID=A0A438DKH3_VITVI|nr:putative methyltransferase PMT7 [Vitis vinifera]